MTKMSVHIIVTYDGFQHAKTPLIMKKIATKYVAIELETTAAFQLPAEAFRRSYPRVSEQVSRPAH